MFVSVLNDRQSFSMQVQDPKSTSGDGWRKVWGKEAAAVNPLAAVNQGRNSLILEAVRTNDWSDYHQFQAKQHPAWYDKVDGEMKQNKLYYGNLIDVQNRSLKEAIQSGDQAEITNRKARLDELITDFKNAPGEVPHVIAFATDPALAESHGIPKPSSDWFNSPYNNALAASQGRFEDQYWYENPYFADHPNEMTFAMEAVKEYRPDIAKIAASINKGAYENNVASSSFNSKATQEIATPHTPVESNHVADQATAAIAEATTMKVEQFARQLNTANLVTDLFVKKQEVETKTSYDYLLERLTQKAEERKYNIV
ncbi:hypothetical protein SLU01_08120 [Sporosarcina luteola]|uniref:Uncharacterized protein n=1 Tax=Sporosarcina luteola TaxID=582850 RepID=A0A511Z4Z7_9BACL|nr:hypothetical protein [Sporosarcina luteola]GEN82500.1 hypothetical protein SLU01_08120 [Sporosarcina luteola]